MTSRIRSHPTVLGAVMLSVAGLAVCALPLISLLPMIGPISILDLAGGALAQGSWSVYRIMTVLSCIALAAGAVIGATVIARRSESRTARIWTFALTVLGTGWVLFLLIALV